VHIPFPSLSLFFFSLCSNELKNVKRERERERERKRERERERDRDRERERDDDYRKLVNVEKKNNNLYLGAWPLL
jgi:hypothetical protein